MKNPPRERPVKDERDEVIDRDSRNRSLELMICATQVLTIICAVKGNSAWKGSLSLLFFGVAAALIYKYKMYGEKPYLYVGMSAWYFWRLERRLSPGSRLRRKEKRRSAPLFLLISAHTSENALSPRQPVRHPAHSGSPRSGLGIAAERHIRA